MSGAVADVEDGIRSGISPLRIGAGLAVSAVLVAGLVLAVGPSRLAARLGATDPIPVGLACAVGLAGLLLRARVARVLYVAATGGSSGPGFYLDYVFASLPKRVVPGGYVAGPGIEAFVLSRNTGTRFEPVFAVFAVAELLNLVASVAVAAAGLGVLVVVGAVSPGPWVTTAVGAAVLAVGVLAGAFALAHERSTVAAVVGVRDAVVRSAGRVPPLRYLAGILAGPTGGGWREFARATGTLAEDRSVVREALFVATVTNVVATVPLYLCLLAIGADPSVGVVLLAVPLSGMVGFSPLPGGVGGTEVVLAGLLVALGGLDPAAAAAATLLYRMATLGVGTLAGAVAAGVLTASGGRSRPV